jgi:ABC-2 type transport system permease protein
MSPARRRLSALLVKESRQIWRDPSALATAFVMPVILLFLFGYGVSLDIEHVPIGVVTESDSPSAADFVGSLSDGRTFLSRRFVLATDGLAALQGGEIMALVRLPQDFARLVEGGETAPVQVLVDGVDANTAHVVQGYVSGALTTWLSWRRQTGQSVMAPPLDPEPRIWFNPEVESRRFLVPGLIAIIMTVLGTLLTALVVAREWERGTMEALLATPMTRLEFLLSKTLPYFLLGMGGMAITVILARLLFHVPLRGSVLVLFAVAAFFMLSALGLGLLISTLARNQFIAGQVSIIAGYLPAFILSGFLFDLRSMPTAIRLISHLVGARYFVSVLQSLFLAGTLWSVIWPNMLWLLLLGGVLFAITARLTRQTLD